MTSHTEVDLSLPPDKRWTFSDEQAQQARSLIDVYMRDIGADNAFLELIQLSAQDILHPEYLAELDAVSRAINLPPAHVLAGNLYYDALKTFWGCTAFAFDSSEGPVHARNLDWGTENRVLNDYTLVTSFSGAPAGPFTTIGWPAFAGVLSAIAPGRFSISLNAVMSTDPPRIATPVVFLLRDVLENANDFAEAKNLLANSTIASDCLLLLAGVNPSDMVVIERTPERHALRDPDHGAIFVTNDYLALSTGDDSQTSELQLTACSRRQRIQSLVLDHHPQNLESCIDYLADDCVRMSITVQQMAFHPRSGDFRIRIP